MANPKRSKSAPIVRRLIVPQKGYVFVLIDQSQSELRILAHFANDRNMIGVFRAGEDIHQATAMEIVKMSGQKWGDLSQAEKKDRRQKAKPVNFGVVYLISSQGLVAYAKSDYGIDMDTKQADMWMSALFRKYPGIKKYQKDVITFGRRHGYVESLLGRRRHLPELNASEKWVRHAAERQAVNTPIQGTSSDMVIDAGNQFVEAGYPWEEARPVLFIHDELIFEVMEDKVDKYVPIIQKYMENPRFEKFGVKLRVPLLAEPKIGVNASDTVDYAHGKKGVA
jgi:DNA polymerase-1